MGSVGADGGGSTNNTQPLRLSFKLGGEKLSTLYTGQVSSPFYTLKSRLPDVGHPIGSTDLLAHYGLAQSYQHFTAPGRVREPLETFLPHLYGNFHFTQSDDFSSLLRLVQKPPITGKEIVPAGPVDEAYRHLFDRRREDLPSENAMQRMDRTPAEILVSQQQSSIRAKEKRKKEHKEKKEKKKKKEKKRKHQEDGDGQEGTESKGEDALTEFQSFTTNLLRFTSSLQAKIDLPFAILIF
ncbi:unnamed protein product, partial [Mesorhabditis belari]|uniref:Mediator of RNA polymerase II transcription subunit 19 n=1 Tax=Mesorhabditis belari TaxID=2138241 RepID=A0AAF3EDH7_9BILA